MKTSFVGVGGGGTGFVSKIKPENNFPPAVNNVTGPWLPGGWCRNAGTIGRFFGGLTVVWLAVSAAGQGPLFTEVQPVFSAGGAPLGHFPALKDMRSVWGDLDGDGDMDVILMGTGPGGPVVKLYFNEGTAMEPFAFVEHPTILPQLQDGALAVGDMDRDGDLDLAITGSVTATPASATDLRAHIFRNDGLSQLGFLQFVEIRPGPWFEGCFHGCVSWGDMDNDGDLDLFVSGYAWNHMRERPEKFARIHRQDRGNLTSSGPSFWNRYGVSRLRDGEEPLPEHGALIREVTWTDVDRDGLQDLMLTTAVYVDEVVEFEDTDEDYAQEVWLNARGQTGTPGDFERLGDSLESQALFRSEGWLGDLERTFFVGSSSLAGGVGDFDGDGHMDLVFNRPVDGEILGQGYGRPVVLYWRSVSLPEDFLIPGFDYGRSELAQVAARSVADFLNLGRDQWLMSAYSGWENSGVGPLYTRLHYSGPVEGRLGLVHDEVWALALPGRFRGAMDAVDANGDGRLDLLHGGFDEGVIVANPEPATRFYRNNVGIANTPPTAPGGLTTVQATPLSVRLRWDPATDAQTASEALGYAIRLRHANGSLYLAPDANSDGRRLKPGRKGVWELTEYYFNAYNGGNGSALPDGTYYWTVQAVDSGGLGSPFAPEQTFIIGDPNPPPDDGQRDADLPYRDSAIDLGDVDNDGALDVVLAGSPPGTGGTIIRRNGGINPLNLDEFLFTAYGPDLPPIERGAARWGDVDGDGDIDLALSGLNRGQPITRVYRNHGGAFEIRNVLEGVSASALDWGDFDNDGDLDLIVTGYRDGKPLTRLYRNGGETNAMPHALVVQPTTLPDIGDGAATWVDFDSDGDLDLLLNGDTQDYSQPGSPCIIPPVHLRPPGVSYACDPALPSAPRVRTLLLRNDGLVTMGFDAGKWRFTPVLTGLPPVFGNYSARGRATRAEWSDYSGDGRPDLLLGGTRVAPAPSTYGWPSARTFRNAGPGGLGAWQFVQGGELLDGILDSALQTLTCADWTQGAGLNGPDVLFGGWVNGPGTVPAQVRAGNGGDDFVPLVPAPFLPFKDDQDAPQFPGGLAAFGHFNEDANVDILLVARWGIQGGGGLGADPSDGRVFLAKALPANLRPTPPTDRAFWLTH